MEIAPKNEETQRALKAIMELKGRNLEDGRKITERLIAEFFGIPPQQIVKMKTGERSIQINEIKILRDIFGINQDFLEGKSEVIFQARMDDPLCKSVCEFLETIKAQLPDPFTFEGSVTYNKLTGKPKSITLILEEA